MFCKQCNTEVIIEDNIINEKYCSWYCVKYGNINEFDLKSDSEKLRIENGIKEDIGINKKINRGKLSIKNIKKLKDSKPLLEREFFSETDKTKIYTTKIFAEMDYCTCKGFTYKDTKRKLTAKGFCKHTKILWDTYNLFNS